MMKRFHKTPIDKWGNVIITDVLNTEPVCHIFASYHPYAADIIYEALCKYDDEIETDVCICGNKKPKLWLHCGCGKRKEGVR